MESFAPFLRKGRSLEIGAYKGEMTRMLFQELKDLTVIEASKDLARDLQQHFPEVRVFNCLVEEWEAEEKFDNIFLIHTLEHIENRLQVLEKIRSLLQPRGLLFIAVPNAHALSRLIAVEMGLIESPQSITEGERLHGHFITYSKSTLIRDVEKAGLNVVENGGVVLKTLSNFQIDRGLESGTITTEYLEACNKLAKDYPEFSSSIFVIASA
jgi:2-polyprenyl-3-methyl-5-hydroxy-6-metoxy-1,4-benzoquinol methylase